jgi:hypothetical protein
MADKDQNQVDAGDIANTDPEAQAARQNAIAEQSIKDQKAAEKAKDKGEEPRGGKEEVLARSGTTAAASFPGYPLTKYNPVLGARTANDPNEAATLFQPEHDWWPTAAEADMHRTDREAGIAIHHNMRTKLGHFDEAEQAPVRNSVQAQESLDTGGAEPL